MSDSKQTDSEREYGEGNYTAARQYQEGARKTAGTKRSEQAAQEAKQAVESPESKADLEAAEREGKRPAEGVPER